MKEFTYTITDELGIHARPAGMLIKECSKFSSEITIETNGKTASGKKLFTLMSLCAKKGDTLSITVNGEDEESTATSIRQFLEQNL